MESKAQEALAKVLEVYKVKKITEILNRKTRVIEEHSKTLESIAKEISNTEALTNVPDNFFSEKGSSNYLTIDPGFFSNMAYPSTLC